MSKEVQFWKRVDFNGGFPNSTDPLVTSPATRCWTWTGAVTSQGYGVLGYNYQQFLAHRLALEFRGIALGEETDHLCRNRLCVNPDHLESVTRRENTARGSGKAAIAIRTDSCKAGHPYVNGSYRIDARGGRVCKKCANRAAKMSTARKRDARLSKREIEYLEKENSK